MLFSLRPSNSKRKPAAVVWTRRRRLDPAASSGPGGACLDPAALSGPSGACLDPAASSGPGGAIWTRRRRLDPAASSGPGGACLDPAAPVQTWRRWRDSVLHELLEVVKDLNYPEPPSRRPAANSCCSEGRKRPTAVLLQPPCCCSIMAAALRFLPLSRLWLITCVSAASLLILFSPDFRSRMQDERLKRDFSHLSEIPAESAIDATAIDLTPLVNTLINSSHSGSLQLFSLLSVSSFSPLDLHRLTLLVYNISGIKSLDSGLFRRRFCYCVTNDTNDLTDFTAILLDVMGNSTSHLQELFKSSSILSVSQRNNSDCIYICVMAGRRVGREGTGFWADGSVTLLFNQTIVEGPNRGLQASLQDVHQLRRRTSARAKAFQLLDQNINWNRETTASGAVSAPPALTTRPSAAATAAATETATETAAATETKTATTTTTETAAATETAVATASATKTATEAATATKTEAATATKTATEAATATKTATKTAAATKTKTATTTTTETAATNETATEAATATKTATKTAAATKTKTATTTTTETAATNETAAETAIEAATETAAATASATKTATEAATATKIAIKTAAATKTATETAAATATKTATKTATATAAEAAAATETAAVLKSPDSLVETNIPPTSLQTTFIRPSTLRPTGQPAETTASSRDTGPDRPRETERPGCPWRRPAPGGDAETLGELKLQPCVLELCRFFSQCLCGPPSRTTRTKRFCDDSFLWYEAQTFLVCRRVKRLSFSRNLKQRCLSKMCNKL
ncbi:HERV-H LTR-associating protein 1 [Poeciliopsis prolifica]|uniref:HERV-H LTR-associating protein 1 n=1 Tax=Poeciliopsis prolifica TaxID=188132 RepID=UPI002413F50E|nr:HERV-H LTR-associating protein 1 [Poeciliopsis prolifica]